MVYGERGAKSLGKINDKERTNKLRAEKPKRSEETDRIRTFPFSRMSHFLHVSRPEEDLLPNTMDRVAPIALETARKEELKTKPHTLRTMGGLQKPVNIGVTIRSATCQMGNPVSTAGPISQAKQTGA